jgi:hypothetical protein
MNKNTDECFIVAAQTAQREAILQQCSNVGLRLSRVRGLCASTVHVTNFNNKEQSYV